MTGARFWHVREAAAEFLGIFAMRHAFVLCAEERSALRQARHRVA